MPGQRMRLGFLNGFCGDVGHLFAGALVVIGDSLSAQIDLKLHAIDQVMLLPTGSRALYSLRKRARSVRALILAAVMRK